MELGLHLPQAGPKARAKDVLDVAIAADDLGFHSVWLFDHLFTPTDIRSHYPGTPNGRYPLQPTDPYLDAVPLLGALAAVTHRVQLGTRVLVPLLRHPVVLAKELTTIDAISGGRLLLGVGTGWMREEFDAVGVGFERRYTRLEEHIALMRNAWQHDVGSFAGEFYTHTEGGFGPPPSRTDRSIPILVGGAGPAAIESVARYGDGWAVLGRGTGGDAMRAMEPSELERALQDLRRRCEEHGRDYEQLEIITSATFDDPPEIFQAHEELGVGVCDVVGFGSPARVIASAERIMKEVGTRLRPTTCG